VGRWLQGGDLSFGSSSSGGKTQRVTVTVPAPLAEQLVRESIDQSSTVSAVVREAVTEYFARREPEGLPGFVGLAEHPDETLSERVEEIIAEDVRRGEDR